MEIKKTQMVIPKQLQIPEIRFVLLEKGGKKPFQKEWQNKHIRYDDEELLNHLSSNGNYGVMGGGKKRLIIIDFDNEKLQNELSEKLPKTFTIKTGSGLLHKYFFSDDDKSFKIFDEDMNTLADIQGEGKQVVGANSIHPNGNKYEVVDDIEISFLNYSELKALIIPYDKKPKKEIKEFKQPKINLTNNFLDRVKDSINFVEVLQSFGIDTSKNPTQCPFHNSTGGKCLGFNNETGHCFHCDGSWNIFSFVKEMKKCDFKEALNYLSNLAGLQDELEKSKREFLENIKDTKESEDKNIREKYLELIHDKKWGNASEVIVNWILKNNYIYTTMDDTKTEMWIYDHGIYVPQGKSQVKKLMRKLLDKFYSAFVYNQVINKLEPDTFIEPDKFFENNRIDEIPVLNGVLNLKSRELKDFSPEKIFFNKMPINYNPIAKCPKIESFLKEVLSNPDDRLVFYELGGFVLWGEYFIEKAIMFVGDGRNGKDKSLELIKRCIGIENTCSISLNSLIPDSFIISELFGKKVNLAGEISNQDLKDTSMFKALTGRSIVSAPRKFLNPITFQNSAKFIFACNELPFVYDNSRGFWDRWVLLEFPFTFLNKNELEKNKGKSNFKLRDENIIEKITTEQELSGLLNKFLDGLDNIKDNKSFSSTKGSEEIKNLWIRKSNSFMAFCMDNIEDSYDGVISKKDMRKMYIRYCKTHKITAKTDKVMKRTLREMYGADEEQKTEDIRNWYRERVWVGITWKNKTL